MIISLNCDMVINDGNCSSIKCYTLIIITGVYWSFIAYWFSKNRLLQLYDICEKTFYGLISDDIITKFYLAG